MGLMTMVSRKMLNKEVIVILSSGAMQGIEMKGILRGYDFAPDTIQLEKDGHVHTYDDVASIEIAEVHEMEEIRIELKLTKKEQGQLFKELKEIDAENYGLDKFELLDKLLDKLRDLLETSEEKN